MPSTELDALVARIRRFNRFYTRRIGALREGLLDSSFTLAEVRLLYEIAHRSEPSAAELARDLGMDQGYLSRLLRGLVRRGLVARRVPGHDGRRRHLRLTAKGSRSFATLDSQSNRQVEAMLEPLPVPERERLAAALGTVERLLGDTHPGESTLILRQHRPGDMGWVVERHGSLYAMEYGWDERFEALVAEIVAQFIQRLDPARERCWIAELNGGRVGSVFLVRDTDEVARLRLLLVDPVARGLGVGKRLLAECIRFARQSRYRRVVLWTNSILDAARHLYEREGFRLINSEPHDHFGHGLVGQTWQLQL